jgi:hypothetical protein
MLVVGFNDDQHYLHNELEFLIIVTLIIKHFLFDF